MFFRAFSFDIQDNIVVSWNRDDMAMLLVKAGPSLTVKSLLENLQITSEFELSMAKKWATGVRKHILISLAIINCCPV